MKVTIKTTKEVDAKTLHVEAGVRYWEDSEVNGIEDTDGNLIPFRKGDYWCPVIDIDLGQIRDWPIGMTADIHYKVCDDGGYQIQDADGNIIITKEGYVPDTLAPESDGYGDYIIMKVDDLGCIANWKFNINDFIDSES